MKSTKSKSLKASENREELSQQLANVSPVELAQLAAILGQGKATKDALVDAMKLYVQAVFFSRDLPSDVRDIVLNYGTQTQSLALDSELGEALERNRLEWEKSLKLDRKAYDDNSPVRRFLAEHGLEIKTAPGVIKNLRRWYERCAKSPAGIPIDLRPPVFLLKANAGEFIEQFKTGAIYSLPKLLLERAARFTKWRAKTRQKKSTSKGSG